MTRIDRFEQKALFAFTRFLALLVVAALLIGIVGSAFYLLTTFHVERNTRIEPGEVLAEIRPPPAPQTADGDAGRRAARAASRAAAPAALAGQHLEFVLQPYLSRPATRAALEKHLRALDAAEAEEYLVNLAEVVAAAEDEQLDAMKAMQLYLNAKDGRIAAMERERQRKKEMRVYVAGGAVSTLVIIALFSLILVLLAIERNTRPLPQAPEANA